MKAMRWKDAMLRRFSDRERVGGAELFERYWAVTGCEKEAVMDALELIEEKFEVPIGLLRPEDELSKLTDPVRTRNPLKWVMYRGITEDSVSELNYQLALRLEKYGVQVPAGRIRTLGDYVRAWCGEAWCKP